MRRFVLLSLGFLGLGFYELSGGADFDPAAARAEAVLTRGGTLPDASTDVVGAEQSDAVARVSLNLVSFDDIANDTAATDLARAERASDARIKPVKFNESPDTGVVLPSLVYAGTVTQASSGAVEAEQEIRSISGDRVNMRGGPGTGFDVVAQLERNTRVEILQDDGSGWVRLRPVGGGLDGWIASFLLTNS